MAEQAEQEQCVVPHDEHDEEDTTNPNYKPPAQKSLQEIQQLDADDESLRKYKETLLAGAKAAENADPNAPNVQVMRMSLVVNGREDVALDLTGDIENLKKTPIVVKEGIEYKIKICFKVNKEIVSGLKYIQTTYRKGLKVDKSDYMVGSYGPKVEEHQFLTTMEEAPKGLIARGSYTIKSKFTDDDKHDHLSWEWCLCICKDWQ